MILVIQPVKRFRFTFLSLLRKLMINAITPILATIKVIKAMALTRGVGKLIIESQAGSTFIIDRVIALDSAKISDAVPAA